MPLSPDFRWIRATQHESGEPTALTLGGVEVARMIDRLDGTWFVLLERQAPARPGEPFAPLVRKDCSSFEQGRRGTEIWAARHQERLRQEVALKVAARPRHQGTRG